MGRSRGRRSWPRVRGAQRRPSLGARLLALSGITRSASIGIASSQAGLASVLADFGLVVGPFLLLLVAVGLGPPWRNRD